MRIVAGCDGGGTKCSVAVANVDERRSEAVISSLSDIGRGLSGSANVATNLPLAVENIASATLQALQELALPRDTIIDHFVLALAGSTRVPHQQIIANIQNSLQVRRVSIVPDVAVLFAAANVKPPAIATIVGTGSIGWLQTESGETYRAGGDGPPDGDLGSGYWIGREAIRQNLLPLDPESTPSPADYARLAPQVFDSVDPTADAILTSAAQHIADLIVGCVQQMETPIANSLAWVCAGGVAIHQPGWIHGVRDHCLAAGIELDQPKFVEAPVDGALRLAADGHSAI